MPNTARSIPVEDKLHHFSPAYSAGSKVYNTENRSRCSWTGNGRHPNRRVDKAPLFALYYTRHDDCCSNTTGGELDSANLAGDEAKAELVPAK